MHSNHADLGVFFGPAFKGRGEAARVQGESPVSWGGLAGASGWHGGKTTQKKAPQPEDLEGFITLFEEGIRPFL
jgi:hypothetical protein